MNKIEALLAFKELTEKLAAIQHDFWVEWSKDLAQQETISIERLEKWKSLWIPYEQLAEADKEFTRRQALEILGFFL